MSLLSLDSSIQLSQALIPCFTLCLLRILSTPKRVTNISISQAIKSTLVVMFALMNIVFHLPPYHLLILLLLPLIFKFLPLCHFFKSLVQPLSISPCRSPPLWSPFLLLHLLWSNQNHNYRFIRGVPSPCIILSPPLHMRHQPHFPAYLLHMHHQPQRIP
jgi:hypothetical protein